MSERPLSPIDVEKALTSVDLESTILTLPTTTATATDASRSLGVEVAQIAKSVLTVGRDGKAVVVVLSGSRRIDLRAVSAIVGTKVRLASPDEVRQRTGYEPGGVPPFGHRERLDVILDESLFEWPEVWAAGGASNTVFCASPERLLVASCGTRAAVSEDGKCRA